MTRLERSRPRPPVRGLHLGLGSFFRAHQAWYTHAANDGRDRGIAAFTGRSAGAADVLAAQDALYVLDVRDDSGDVFQVVESLAAVHPASDEEAWRGYWADPAVTWLTLTVTEAGYLTDVARADDAARRTPVGRIVNGLLARRAADAGPIALIPCDNLAGNGAVLARAVRAAAERVDPTLLPWIESSAMFVSTVVDRITPATTDVDRRRIGAATGMDDRSPVVTEPFSDWILSSSVGVDVPRWDTAGASWVSHTAPYEARKLFLLNGAHSLLAYGGTLRGHRTVAEAIADEILLGWVEDWWHEARPYVPVPDAALDDYLRALLVRWKNSAIAHRLDQIAMDGSQKLPVRVLPVVLAERAAGRVPQGACRTLAAWVLSLRGPDGPAPDPRAAELVGLSGGELGGAVARALAALDVALADDGELVSAVVAAAKDLETMSQERIRP